MQTRFSNLKSVLSSFAKMMQHPSGTGPFAASPDCPMLLLPLQRADHLGYAADADTFGPDRQEVLLLFFDFEINPCFKALSSTPAV